MVYRRVPYPGIESRNSQRVECGLGWELMHTYMLVLWQDGFESEKKKNERLKTDYWGEKYFRLETAVSAASGSLPTHSPALMQVWLEEGISPGTLHTEGLAGRRLKPTPFLPGCQTLHEVYTDSLTACVRPCSCFPCSWKSPLEIYSVIVPISQISKLRFRDVN